MYRIPSATYRLQLSKSFNFNAARDLLDYLELLGISDLYLSPLFRSREESSHGYDVVSHSEIEPEFGALTDFHRLADAVRARDLGILLDVVPNHMGINDDGNAWWHDTLENGPLSKYAGFFDIDWDRPVESLKDKLLLPFLGDHFGAVLERGELRLSYDAGRFKIRYGSLTFPLAFPAWVGVLDMALENLNGSEVNATQRAELESIVTQLRNLPTRNESDTRSTYERYREQQIAAERLASLIERSSTIGEVLLQVASAINGEPGRPASFSRLEALLDDQWYRLAYWQVAADEINYRRFFDINDLAAIRVEIPEVFTHVHALVLELLAAGRVTGLRIDHPDGLYDPQQYFEQLQQRSRECCPIQSPSADPTLYVVAEKILGSTEELPPKWPVAGTTGYELLNQIGSVLVDEEGLKSLQLTYDGVTDRHDAPIDVVYESKKQILHDSMASELSMLAARLYRIAQQNRMSRDFTFPSILRALREVIASFPVYRTYVRSQGWDIDAVDQGRIRLAVRLARRRNPVMSRDVLNFVSSVLLLEFPADMEKSQRERWRDFVSRFQQVTGPVTAKGVEDTAFYRYYPLASLNEVGSELTPSTLTVALFHGMMQRRMADWPHSLSATATHDTKRGEDTRARISVLSQVPELWAELVKEWAALVSPLIREVDGRPVPDGSERYFLLQTLVGTWPDGGPCATSWPVYQRRIVEYLTKAMREAKLHTSWMSPSREYETALLDFAADVLNPEKSSAALQCVDGFVSRISDAGFVNSLAQVVLKTCVPGVPDFYQGTELWDFSLVDPDNRRRVDYESRRGLLRELAREFAVDPVALNERLASSWPDPQIKLFVTWRLLQLRKANTSVFSEGDYVPLEVTGAHADKVVAFARRNGNTWMIVAVPRSAQSLLHADARNLTEYTAARCRINWGDTRLILPMEAGINLENILTGEVRNRSELQYSSNETLSLARMLTPLPIAVFRSQTGNF